MPKTYSPPRLNPRQLAAVENGEYDFLIPTRKTLMRTDEVCAAIGRSGNFVRALGEAGKLEMHGARGGRASMTFTRRSVILHMVETSNYDPAFIVMRIEVVMKTLQAAALDRLIAFAKKQKERIS